MLKKRRGILALLALSSLAAVIAGGAFFFYAQQLPDPAKASQRDLLRWLIARDLEKESAPLQLVLAQRLESEFSSGVDWSLFKNKIDAAQRERLLKNVPCVLRAWFLEKAETYERLAADQRLAFLDQMIDTLEVWKGVEQILPKDMSASAKSLDLSSILMKEMKKLKATLPESRQKQIDQLCVAMQTRWFLRNILEKGRKK